MKELSKDDVGYRYVISYFIAEDTDEINRGIKSRDIKSFDIISVQRVLRESSQDFYVFYKTFTELNQPNIEYKEITTQEN